MTLRRALVPAVFGLAFTVAACSGDKDSPTAPTPPPTPTRIIRLEGNMNFGSIQIGQSFDAVLRIYNDGSEALTVSGLTAPASATSVIAASWTNGTIAPGTSQASTIRFTPTEARSYSGTLTVNANHTSGSNTLPLVASGVMPPRAPFSRNGSGNTVFDMPTGVTRLLIRGRWTGRDTSNFIVYVGGRLVVNEILRTSITYEGVHAVSGTTVEIVSSSAIDWSFQEV